MKKHTIKLNEDDWHNILAILDIRKRNTKDREDALELQRMITTIKQQLIKS